MSWAGVLLLALKLTFPPHVEQSTGAECKVVRTSKAAGDCEPDYNSAHSIARWWRACGYVKWEGVGPKGEDVFAEVGLWAGDSRKAALGQCEKFLEAYERRMGTKR